MNALLGWFAAAPFWFFLTGFVVLLAFLLSSIRQDEGGARYEWAFLTFLAVTILVWRWPMFLWPSPLNMDEGEFTAGALKATVDMRPWVGFDPSTSGPLNAYVLALPALFGMRLDFFSTRLVGIAMVIGTIWGLYFAVRWTYDRLVARLATIPVVLFMAPNTQEEFIHCSSEHLPILLTTVALSCAAYLASERGGEGKRLAACAIGGLCVGAAPFAKIQAAPIAAAVFVLLIAAAFFTRSQAGRRFWYEAITTAVASSIVPLALILAVVAAGGWRYAAFTFITANLGYTRAGYSVGAWFYVHFSPWFTSYMLGCIIAIALGVAALAFGRGFSRRSLVILGGLLLFTVAAVYAIQKPHRPWGHYLLFLVAPLAVSAASALGLTRERDLWRGRERLVALCFVSLFVLPTLAVMASTPHRFLVANADDGSRQQAAAINRHAPPGSRISIWGWMPHYYLKTGTIPATRFATIVGDNPYARLRYLADFQASRPIVFADAVAPVSFRYTHRETQGLESFPALEVFVRANYTLVEEVEGVRIFTRNSPDLRP